MNTSHLEITENEYCIRLNKEAFDLTLIRQLIKRIQSEQFFFSKVDKSYDDDIISRTGGSLDDENFDRLCDK
jgi:molybdate-binding protein